MTFKKIADVKPPNFDSLASMHLLDVYEEAVNDRIKRDAEHMPSRSFAASSFRCDRRSWFRLRGVKPDSIKRIDRTLDFISSMGTACHRMVQSDLKNKMQWSWVDVYNHICQNCSGSGLDASYDDSTGETFVVLKDPPCTFACDGIIDINDQRMLLEIKTSESRSFRALECPKQEHIDQVIFYATMLRLKKALVFYVDRQYGDTKCFQIDVLESDRKRVWSKIKTVMECVDSGVAPDPLPVGDKWCTPSMCPYYRRCREYGKF